MTLSFACFATACSRPTPAATTIKANNVQHVKNLVESSGIPSMVTCPQHSLRRGNWVKLICGASFEDVVDVRNLSLVYTLAGVDCIDCAADVSVVNAVNEGIEIAQDIIQLRRPWVMVSVNDDEDLHFRKAEFDPEDCPPDCSKPCETVCPANAISLKKKESLSSGTNKPGVLEGGVITERCYGCGRCSPVCPYDRIGMTAYMRDASATAELLKRKDVDAIEIHTGARNTGSFEELWEGLGDSVSFLKLVAVSLPNIGEPVNSLMSSLYSVMRSNLHCHNLWQLDGRPMSGDIGRGATREAIRFAVQLAASEDRPPGYLQLAGGTNAHTADGLKREGLFQVESLSFPGDSVVSGVAFGGYARKIVGRILRSMESEHGLAANIENHPEHLKEALREALSLVGTFKCYSMANNLL